MAVGRGVTAGDGAPAAPVVIDFPLRGGPWVAVNSPADRVPSHGTDLLGQRYAIDLLRVDDREPPRYHRASMAATLLAGVPTRECYAWGEPIHAPFAGVIVVAVDGVPERARVHPVVDGFRAVRTGLTFRPTPDRLPAVLGNHVILVREGVHAAAVHLATGSVTVAPGDHVEAGQRLGRVGHSGNSTTPHLHLQLMDAADPLVARAIPLAFRAYEVRRDGGWVRVQGGVPGKDDRIRSVD